MSVEADLRAAVAALGNMRGGPILPVTTTAPELPWCVFRTPSLDICGQYVQQSRENPLLGAMGLARVCMAAAPEGFSLEALIASKPFVVMRAVQVLLGEMGLSTRAEKKSLN